MAVRIVSTCTTAARRGSRHAALLAGVSAVALILANSGAVARPLGGGTPAASSTAVAAVQSASQEAATAARQASSALKRATQSIQAMQAAQNAARNAALQAQGTIPNGLRPGGLQVAPGAVSGSQSWQGGQLPTEAEADGRTLVNIKQTQQRAIFTWQTFNVGKETAVNFDQQGNTSWVALNRVLDTAEPSRVLGSIKADGSVYIINRNGIIFGGTAQVNVGALIASSANIADDQFLNQGIYSKQSGSIYTPSFTDAGGVIKVEPGALIQTNTPPSVTQGGGFVLLIGTQVENAGSISTPRGQTQLAAGDDFILRPGYGPDANLTSTTRGNEIAPVFHTGSASGLVRNSGLVVSQQGDITLAGRIIEQNGILVASTSVNTRGTIHLLNSASDALGRITLGADSVTTIIPEYESEETALNSRRDALVAASVTANERRSQSANGVFDNLSLLADRLDQSRIEIVSGGEVIFRGGAAPEAGSLTIAQGGQVAVSAGRRIFTEAGSTIDVSGARDVVLAMSANNVTVNIQGNELRDSPQNRDSNSLQNANIWVDIRDLVFVPAGTGGYDSDRYYTPGGLLEIGGYLANTKHTIGEWTAVGGTIALAAPEVIAQQGSIFDISGGSVRYDSGYIRTTNFLGSDGKTSNVNAARGDMTFYGLGQGYIRKHERWGVTEVWTNPLGRGRESLRWEDGYTVGRDAGQLILSTPTAIFEGDIVADVVQGDRQINARPDGITDGFKVAQNTVAKAGTLAVGQYGSLGLTEAYTSGVRIGNVANITAAMGSEDPLERAANTVWLDSHHLTEQGLGGLTLVTRGTITVESDLALADGARVDLVAPTIDIDARVTARSGDIRASNILVARSTLVLTHEGTSSIGLGAKARLDVGGRWVNALREPAHPSQSAFIAGGAVSVRSTGDVMLAPGALIDASAGVFVSPSGSIDGGSGGDVALVAGYSVAGAETTAGALSFGGDVRAYGFGTGGTLTLQAGQRDVAVAGTAPSSDTLVALSEELFSAGFSHYVVATNRGIRVDGSIEPVVPVYRLTTTNFAAVTDGGISGVAELWLPQVYLENPSAGTLAQRAGADIALIGAGSFVLAAGKTIGVDPGRTIEIQSHGQTTIDGTIRARGGDIVIGSDLHGVSLAIQTGALGQSIWIGERARLDAAAQAYTAVDAAGHHYGVVPDGGSISIGLASLTPDANGVLLATQSMVVIRPGAVLEASGASGSLDLPFDTANRATRMLTAVASNGGSIVIGSMNGLYLDGDLRAAAGGAGASGGSLTLALENAALDNGLFGAPGVVRVPRVLTIAQQHARNALPAALTAGETNPAIIYGTGRISVEQVAAGGFDDLMLWSRDVIRFDGNVNLSMGRSLALYRGVLSPATAETRVRLSAPHVLLDGAVNIYQLEGMSYAGLFLGVYSPATINHGGLRVEADLIDFRNRVWSGATSSYQDSTAALPTPFEAAGFGDIDLVSRGDIRFGNGFLASGGNHITLEAAQIYPLTGAAAVIGAGMRENLPGADGIITVRGNGNTPSLPQSVFGSLGLVATTIDQGGILRAPLGTIVLGDRIASVGNFPQMPVNVALPPVAITLREGSITSTSGAGLVMPYGGTVDGQVYSYAGAEVAFADIANMMSSGGVTLKAERIVAETGSLLDLSGGGQLTGAGFVSGRGGSVDVLRTPLVNANPAYGYSAESNAVYAIMPGYAGGYAPASPDHGAGDPNVGQQITLSQPVGGLPAGTYTLLPSTYALLPGAWRVEVGGTTMRAGQTAALGNGSYVSTGTVGFANTDIRATLPNGVVLTPGNTVRTYSHYNETNYSDFARANAALFGLLRPRLPVDAQVLNLDFKMGTGDVLSFEGVANFAPVDDGYSGILGVRLSTNIGFNPPSGSIEIRSSGASATAGMTSLAAEHLSRFNAGALLIGGGYSFYENTSPGAIEGPRVFFGGSAIETNIVVRGGATVRAGQITLIAANEVVVEAGAVLDTTRSQARIFDSSAGYVFANWATFHPQTGEPLARANAMLTVSNGELNFLAPAIASTGTITIEDGAVLRTLGTVDFTASQGVNLGTDVALNARYLSLSLPEINVGTDDSLAAARASGALGSGWTLTQSMLDRMLSPADPALPGVQRLTLSATSSLNFFGDVSLDMRGGNGVGGRTLALNTPAIFGWGTTNDVATLRTDILVWNGSPGNNDVLSRPYGALTPGVERPGTGSGALRIDAREIVFGYGAGEQYQNETALDRLVLGFANVVFAASERITANNRGTLSVYRSYDLNTRVFTGGDLDLTSPLLTAQGGAMMAYKAGGGIAARARGSAVADTTRIRELGGELNFSAGTISIDTVIALPSGRLTLAADGDVTIADRALIDLSGRSVAFFDVTKHSWGGDLVMRSTNGQVVQSAGSVIDVSAANSDAGSITVEAAGAGGRIALAGTLRGGGGEGYDDGAFNVRVTALSDFVGLNTLLNAGEFFHSRHIATKTGDIVVGDEVRARNVSLSADGGSLSVHGTIDASGAAPGTIRLAARDNLTLTSTAVLDAHGRRLQVDSNGQAIDANNRGHVELTSSEGRVGLAPGATIDLATPDGIARGQIEINAPRLGGADGAGAGANDIAVDAAGPLIIRGAASIAVNGFRRYELPDGGTLDQALFDSIHGDSSAFVDAARTNTDLQSRLTGLTVYGQAFHLRPGVEIRSEGDLATRGDIDFSGYRYGPQANPAVRGAGEAGVVWVRAGGDFKVNGSITDGFGQPLASPDDIGWILPTGIELPNDVTVPADIVLPGNASGSTTFSNTPGLVLEFDIPLDITEIKADVVIPVAVELSGPVFLPAGFVLTGDIARPDGTVLTAGTKLATATTIQTGSLIKAGNVLPDTISITPMTWRAGTPLNVINSSLIRLAGPVTVRAGAVVPAGMTLPRVSQTLAANTVISAPVVLAGSFPARAGVSLAFPISIAISNTIRRGVAIPFAFTTGPLTNVTLPVGWVPSARILNADGTVAFAAGQPVPAGSKLAANMRIEAGIVLPTGGTLRTAAGTIIPANTMLGNCFTGTLTLATPAFVDAGMTLPSGAVIQPLIGAELRDRANDGSLGHMYAIAPMLDQGMQSWSMRYVSGADLRAADTRSIGLAGTGDIILNDPHFHFGTSAQVQQAISVLRTGTGYLDLLAGGNYEQKSLFGVYTAGTQTGSVARDAVSGDDPFTSALPAAKFYFTEGAGDVLISARGNLQGFIAPIPNSTDSTNLSSFPANWLLSDGDNWGVNFGTFDGSLNVLRGFASIGSIGGNVVVTSGGNARNLAAAIGGIQAPSGGSRSFGGGNLTIDIAGSISGASLADARGDIDVSAASFGSLTAFQFGKRHESDPRALDVTKSYGSIFSDLSNMTIGDGVLTAYSRSELVASVWGINGLNTDRTRAVLFAASGDVGVRDVSVPSLSAIAAAGDILLSGTSVLAPSPLGQLELLAWHSINGRGDLQASGLPYLTVSAGDLTGNLHIDDPEPIRLYAVNGDILDVRLGNRVLNSDTATYTYDDVAGKQAWLLAGRDIVGLDAAILNNRATDVSRISAGRDIIYANVEIAGPGTLEITTGRNFYQADRAALTSLGPLVRGDTRPGADIAVMVGIGTGAPGVGSVAWNNFANLYLDFANQAEPQRPLAEQPGKVALTYEEELVQWLADRYGFDGGAETAFAYFAALSPEQQRVFLRQVYFAELLASGREYNDPGSSRFNSYLRGRNAIAALFPAADAAGNAIQRKGDLVLFQGVNYNSGIRTIVGGSIQAIVPNGQITVGISGVTPVVGPINGTPRAPAGLLTQGNGDIRLYSRASILLGLSRIMTAFGGDIQAWSAEGDINAGRGDKTTVIYTPARRVYDAYGNVVLSPDVPSSGAGIATLNPVPSIGAGDIDLIAPLGTIDAGEAGIRVAGNVNLAALHIVNAANIQVQGSATGIPTVQPPNVSGALTAANTAGAAAQQATPPRQGSGDQQPSIIIVEVLGFGGGSGEAEPDNERRRSHDGRSSNQDPNGMIRVLGNGIFTAEDMRQLTADERNTLTTQIAAPSSP